MTKRDDEMRSGSIQNAGAARKETANEPEHSAADSRKMDPNELNAISGGVDEEYFQYVETTCHSKRKRGRLVMWSGR